MQLINATLKSTATHILTRGDLCDLQYVGKFLDIPLLIVWYAKLSTDPRKFLYQKITLRITWIQLENTFTSGNKN